jgi:hypothetical protein
MLWMMLWMRRRQRRLVNPGAKSLGSGSVLRRAAAYLRKDSIEAHPREAALTPGLVVEWLPADQRQEAESLNGPEPLFENRQAPCPKGVVVKLFSHSRRPYPSTNSATTRSGMIPASQPRSSSSWTARRPVSP